MPGHGAPTLNLQRKKASPIIGERIVAFGLLRSTRTINDVLPTFHVYRAVIDAESENVVEKEYSPDAYLLWEAQHLLEQGLAEEFERLTTGGKA